MDKEEESHLAEEDENNKIEEEEAGNPFHINEEALKQEELELSVEQLTVNKNKTPFFNLKTRIYLKNSGPTQ